MRLDDSVVVVIDVQTRLLNVIWQRDRLVDRTTRLLRGAAVLGVPILATEQVPEKLGPTDPAISPLLPRPPIAKCAFSALGEPAFEEWLERTGRKTVWLAGVESHVCVYQTAADLLAAGYRVEVIVDAVSSRTDEDRRVGLERMRAMGAGWMTVEMALFAALRRAEGDRFREIYRIIK